jgi:cation-transporting ATPase 13A3/4/5
LEVSRVVITAFVAVFVAVFVVVFVPIAFVYKQHAMYILTVGYSGPSKVLSDRRPLGTLVGPLVISSLVIHCVWIVLFQMGVWVYMQTSLWFQKVIPDPDGENIFRYENGILFVFSNFQYIVLALVLSSGPPYRQPVYCNFYLMFAVGILLPFCILLAVAPSSWLLAVPLSILEIKQSPSWKFRLFIVETALLNFLVAYIVVHVLGSQGYRKLLRIVRRKKSFKNKYKHILKELKDDPNWPPRISAQ